MTLFSPQFYDRHHRTLMRFLFAAGLAGFIATAFLGDGDRLLVGDAKFYFEYSRHLLIEGHLPREPIAYPGSMALVGLVGHGIARLLTGGSADGWSLAEQVGFALPWLLSGLLTCALTISTLARLGIPGPTARLVMPFWIMGTPIAWYLFKEPGMSEAATWLTVTWFWWQLVRIWQHPGAVPARDWYHLGLALGCAFAIRQQNILHLAAVPLLLWPRCTILAPSAAQLGRAILLAALGGLPGVLLPYVLWYFGAGATELFHYKVAGSEPGFTFLTPHIVDVLFLMKYHGLIPWSLLAGLGLWGLKSLFRNNPGLGPAVIVVMALHVWLIASWKSWWFGDGFGNRGFFTIYPLIVFGAAEFVRRHITRWPRLTILALFGLCLLEVTLMALTALRKLPTNPQIWEDWGWMAF